MKKTLLFSVTAAGLMVLAAGCGSQQKIMGDAKGVDSGELTGIQKAFMDYVRSDAGLKIVEDMGFIPVK